MMDDDGLLLATAAMAHAQAPLCDLQFPMLVRLRAHNSPARLLASAAPRVRAYCDRSVGGTGIDGQGSLMLAAFQRWVASLDSAHWFLGDQRGRERFHTPADHTSNADGIPAVGALFIRVRGARRRPPHQPHASELGDQRPLAQRRRRGRSTVAETRSLSANPLTGESRRLSLYRNQPTGSDGGGTVTPGFLESSYFATDTRSTARAAAG